MGLSTHILDTALGRPAAHVPITLAREQDGQLQHVHAATTDADGRVKSLLPEGTTITAATYRIRFDTAGYFAAQHLTPLYPFVDVTFTVTHPEQHHHIPLLLTANGYTTYRGS